MRAVLRHARRDDVRPLQGPPPVPGHHRSPAARRAPLAPDRLVTALQTPTHDSTHSGRAVTRADALRTPPVASSWSEADAALDTGSAVAERRIVDELGMHWAVREVDGRRVPGARGTTCLVFDSGICVRRVWDMPADWRSLTDAELVAVSRRR